MLYALAISLHILAAVIWVGGMFFAHFILRPSANQLFEPPQRLPLMTAVFQRFFPWVWIAIVILSVTGVWLLLAFGGMGAVKWHVHLMLTLSLVMTALFTFLFVSPYPGLRQAVAQGDYPAGGKHLARIRLIITINLVLGLLTSAIGAGGRYL